MAETKKEEKKTGGECSVRPSSLGRRPHSSTGGEVHIGGRNAFSMLLSARYYVCDHCSCLFLGDDQ